MLRSCSSSKLLRPLKVFRFSSKGWVVKEHMPSIKAVTRSKRPAPYVYRYFARLKVEKLSSIKYIIVRLTPYDFSGKEESMLLPISVDIEHFVVEVLLHAMIMIFSH